MITNLEGKTIMKTKSNPTIAKLNVAFKWITK